MELNGRKVVMRALVGSHNYKLATKEMVHTKTGIVFPASDKDYKAYVLPTFEELYNQKMFQDTIITPTEDVDAHDVRKMVDLFFKANLNYLEPLFSTELWFEGEEMQEIVKLRNQIFNMNLPKLFNALGGTFLQKMKLLPKGTEGTQFLVDLFGYDTKQAQHAFRMLDFAVRYEATGFKDVEKALRYEDYADNEFMLDIKTGFFTKENFERFVYFYHDSRFVHLKEKYHAQPVNLELKEHLDSLVMKMVRKHIVGA